jgi:phosphohistidine phosphatase SixA
MALATRAKVLAGFAVGLLLGSLLVLYDRSRRDGTAPLDAGLPQAHEALADVARAVQQGGYLLHFRHGHRQKWDSVWAFDVYEMATGRDGAAASFRDAVCLSPQGTEEAKMIGEVFRLGRIPVGTVVASPICRARQTALLAFGRIDLLDNALAHTPVTYAGNAEAFGEGLRRFLTTVPIEPGRNTVVTAHGNTLENHPDLFASGRDLLNPQLLLETGFYVIRRDADGTLHVVQRFGELGTFAAHVMPLDPAGVMFQPVAGGGAEQPAPATPK